MGAEITVIDRNGGKMAAIAREVYRGRGCTLLVNSVWEMVDGVLTTLRNSQPLRERPCGGQVRIEPDPYSPVAISLLRIIGHGQPGRQWLGDSETTANRRQLIGLDSSGHLANRGTLVQLRGHFEQNAVVELHGCEVGSGTRGQALRHALEALWPGVRVRAGNVVQYSGTPGFDVFTAPPPRR